MKSRVANRVTEILESSTCDDWNHVPGEENPADILTRGVSHPEQLMKNCWFTGPEFLGKDEEVWPSSIVEDLCTDDVEVKRNPVFTGVALIEVASINWLKISSWVRLLRVAA